VLLSGTLVPFFRTWRCAHASYVAMLGDLYRLMATRLML
jgi:hypothetical protein